MKKTLLRLICLALAILMAFSVAGCKKKATASFDDEDGEFEVDWTKGKGTTSLNEESLAKSTKVVEAAVTDADSLSWNQLVAQIPANLKGRTLTVYSWNPAKEVTGAEKVIADFTKQTGIKVKWTSGAWADYDQKIAAMINSGDSPDLIRYRGPNIHRMALCQDIKSATGYDCQGAIWDSRIAPYFTIKGKQYGVNLRNTLVTQPRFIQYRQTVIDECRLEDPYVLWKNGQWTWDKLVDMCKQYKELYPNRTPLSMYDGADLVWMGNNQLINFDGNKFTSNIADANVYKGLKGMCSLFKQGVINGSVRGAARLTEGTCLFLSFNSISCRVTNANLTDVKKEDDLYGVPLPDMGEWKTYEGTVMSEMEAYGVPKGAKNGDLVYYFLRSYLNADNYDKNTYFVNSQALEAYESCMSADKLFYELGTDLLDIVDGGPGVAGLTDWVRLGGDAAQLQQELDSVSPIFDLAVKKANEVLANFK